MIGSKVLELWMLQFWHLRFVSFLMWLKWLVLWLEGLWLFVEQIVLKIVFTLFGVK